MTFQYSTDGKGFLLVSSHFWHTVWPVVLQVPGFWIFLIVHVLAWGAYQYRTILFRDCNIDLETLAEQSLHLSWHNIHIIAAVTTFFEVFYTTSSYQRYIEFNHRINQSFRTCHHTALLVHAYISPFDKPAFEIVVRWMRASLLLFLIRIRLEDVEPGQWQWFVEAGFLMPNERTYLEALTDGQRFLALTSWMTRMLVVAHTKIESFGPTLLKRVVDHIVFFDEAQKETLDLVRMPVPFQYFHLLNYMVCINVALWAYKLATTDSYLAPIIYFFASFIFVGMLELAKRFADPLGDDDVDFPLDEWVAKFLENQKVLLESDYPGDFLHLLHTQRIKQVWSETEMTLLLGKNEKARAAALRLRTGSIQSTPSVNKRTATLRQSEYTLLPTRDLDVESS